MLQAFSQSGLAAAGRGRVCAASRFPLHFGSRAPLQRLPIAGSAQGVTPLLSGPVPCRAVDTPCSAEEPGASQQAAAPGFLRTLISQITKVAALGMIAIAMVRARPPPWRRPPWSPLSASATR
jgi:hypothetical protein